MGSLEETKTDFTLTLTVSLDKVSLQLEKVAASGLKRKHDSQTPVPALRQL